MPSGCFFCNAYRAHVASAQFQYFVPSELISFVGDLVGDICLRPWSWPNLYDWLRRCAVV